MLKPSSEPRSPWVATTRMVVAFICTTWNRGSELTCLRPSAIMATGESSSGVVVVQKKANSRHGDVLIRSGVTRSSEGASEQVVSRKTLCASHLASSIHGELEIGLNEP